MNKIAPLILLLLAASCGDIPEFDRDLMERIHDYTPSPAEDAKEGSPLRITILDVGQGDAVVISAPSGETMLIDAGPPEAGREIVIPYLRSRGIDGLTHIIATHYHSDHIGGLVELLLGDDGIRGTDDDFIPSRGIFDRGEDTSTLESQLYPLYSAIADGARSSVHAGDEVEMGDLVFRIMGSAGLLIDDIDVELGDPPDENAASVAILLEYGDFRMFMGGDITGGGIDSPDIETPLAPLIGDIDVLKASHHGSQTSTSQTFLDQTKPEVAIISVGDSNEHGHPHPEVVDRLIDAEIEIYLTERGFLDLEGPIVANNHISIEVEADGEYVISIEGV